MSPLTIAGVEAGRKRWHGEELMRCLWTKGVSLVTARMHDSELLWLQTRLRARVQRGTPKIGMALDDLRMQMLSHVAEPKPEGLQIVLVW